MFALTIIFIMTYALTKNNKYALFKNHICRRGTALLIGVNLT
ncbi:hypothetical protein NSTC745_04407 [Nostoc sp. DSM 114161]|jgi:hypothetical protein